MTQFRKAEFINMDTTDVGEAIYEADHNFVVDMVPLTMPDGHVIYDKKAVIRTDTGRYLGTVGKGVHHIQPVKFYGMAHQLIMATGGRITKTITMGGGAVIGISFQLATREYISGDVVNLNFLMLTSFDSSYAILGRTLSERLVCLNQLPSSKKLFNIKNTQYQISVTYVYAFEHKLEILDCVDRGTSHTNPAFGYRMVSIVAQDACLVLARKIRGFPPLISPEPFFA